MKSDAYINATSVAGAEGFDAKYAGDPLDLLSMLLTLIVSISIKMADGDDETLKAVLGDIKCSLESEIQQLQEAYGSD